MSAKVFDIIDLENNIHFQCREDVYILDAGKKQVLIYRIPAVLARILHR